MADLAQQTQRVMRVGKVFKTGPPQYTTKHFPSSRCASAIQTVRPSESIAETQLQLQPDLLRFGGHLIVSFDRPFDNLGFLSNKFRQMLLYVIRGQAHRLISTSFVLKD